MKKCRDSNIGKQDVLTRSATHKEKINDLLKGEKLCEEIIKVIEETGAQLNLCT